MGQDPDVIRRDIEETRERMGERVDALGYKADVKSRAKESVAEKVDTARRVAGVAQENPLGLAIGSVAVGFLAGMLIPSTRIEDEKIGDVADQVKDRVKETGQEALERGKEVAGQAAQAAKDTAQEQGREHASQMQESVTSS